jgi:BirA family biotin operon repressor/biotin-[acetyl-CoA-carboxylase] ligase
LHYTSEHKGQFGKEVIHLDACQSTNDYAKKLLKEESLKNGQVVITNYQSKGRGRAGKYWESEPGSNLLLSIFIKPENIKVEKQYFLNLVFSLGILKTLRQLTGKSGFKVKWPNDVYFGDRKIAGILIENFLSGKRIDEVIVGIGLNVNQHSFHTPGATSIYQILRMPFQLNEVFQVLMQVLENEYKHLINNNLEEIRSEYNDLLYWKDEWRTFKTDSIWEGRITGTDQSGRLVVQQNGTESHFVMNQIEFVE